MPAKTPAKTSNIIKIIIVSVIIVLPLVIFSSGFFASSSEKIYSGVEFMGTDLGGLNKEEGMAKLAETEKSFRAKRVALRYHGWSSTLLLNEVGFEINKEAVITEALNAGKQGSIIKRWQDRKQIEKNGLSLQTAFTYDEEKLSQRLKDLTGEITTDPVEATFRVGAGDRVTVVPSQDGMGLDLEKLKKDIVDVLNNRDQEVDLSLVPVSPSRTTAALESMNINGLLGGYTTHFDAGKVSRTYNISVAARAFDELLVMPGQVVSFNEVVGPRSSEAGYKTAPVIVNDELVDGLGGGVCQVSTTLYNSVLMANLEIEERYNHSIPVSYVPIGRDATVVYDALDFKFGNNTGDYLYIKSYLSGGQITINIYGNTAYKRDVRIDSVVTDEINFNVVYETDPNLPKGTEVVKKEGSNGFLAYTERVVFLNGKVEKRDAQSYSDYNPINKVIAVGTSETLPQVAPSKPGTPGGQVIPPGGQDQPTGGATTGGGSTTIPAIPGANPPAGGRTP
ncbi:VanW family protein [Pelotomaculum propionicicum]|uniref:VanW family protein n=1 Tax=Pelotomaculum propionicicum TaxID=258475 RepID=UPI003B7FD05D